MDMHHSFARSPEWRIARDSELEFIELARAIGELAREMNVSPDMAVDTLARRGTRAALALLSEQTGAAADAHFLHRCVLAQASTRTL